MSVEPVLIETSAGAVGAVLTLPASPPRAAAVILPGAGGSTRSGLDQMFARLASSLAGIGVSSIRFDYPGSGESHLCRLSRWAEGSAEAIDWFQQDCGARPLLLVAECGGLLQAHREVMSGRDVLAVGLFLPPFQYGSYPLPLPLVRRLRGLAGRIKRLPGHWLLRVRYGPSDPKFSTMWPRGAYRAMARSEAMLVELSERVPLWVLSADADPSTRVLERLQDQLAAGIGYELEVLPSGSPVGSSPPGAAEIVRATTAWAAGRLDRAGESRVPLAECLAPATTGSGEARERLAGRGHPINHETR